MRRWAELRRLALAAGKLVTLKCGICRMRFVRRRKLTCPAFCSRSCKSEAYFRRMTPA